MTFSGKRLEFCVVCERKLPDGSRIDRKYCSAACIERAYYQRHPEKAHVPGSRRRKIDKVEVGLNPFSDEAMGSGRPVEAAPGNWPQRYVAREERTDRLPATVPPSVPTTTAAKKQALALKEARRQNSELQRKLEAAIARETHIKERLAELRTRSRRASKPRATTPDRTQLRSARKQAHVVEPANHTGQVVNKRQRALKTIAGRENAGTVASQRLNDAAKREPEPLRQNAPGTAPTSLGAPAAAPAAKPSQSLAVPSQPSHGPASALDRTAGLQTEGEPASASANDEAKRERQQFRPAAPGTAPPSLQSPVAAQAARPQSPAASSQPLSPQESPPERPTAGSGLGSPTVWEWHSKRSRPRPVLSRFDSLSAVLVKTLEFCRGVLVLLPQQIRKTQGRRAAEHMRRYLKALSDAKILEPLSIALVRRIIGTDPASRATDEQKGTLARWVLEAAIAELLQQGSASAVELKQEMARGAPELLIVAQELVFLCHDTWLKSG